MAGSCLDIGHAVAPAITNAHLDSKAIAPIQMLRRVQCLVFIAGHPLLILNIFLIKTDE